MPGLRVEVTVLFRGCPMSEYRTCISFARTHQVDAPVTIQVGEDCVLGRFDVANRHRGPDLICTLVSGVEVRAHRIALFPWHGNVHQPISVDIHQSDAIGTSRTVVYRVPLPGFISTCEERQRCRESDAPEPAGRKTGLRFHHFRVVIQILRTVDLAHGTAHSFSSEAQSHSSTYVRYAASISISASGFIP